MVEVSQKWARPTNWWRERGLSGLIISTEKRKRGKYDEIDGYVDHSAS